MTRLAILLTVASVWMSPTEAHACSCAQGSGDIARDLREARQYSNAIYRARILSVTPVHFGGTAVIEVLEAFKGKVIVGEQFELPSGGGGDCTVGFQAESEYLMYAGSDGPTSVGLCSRTRRITSKEDSELRWLRTRKLPPIPVAMQRESVSCEPCDIRQIGGRLSSPPGAPLVHSVWGDEADAAMKTGRPFFTYSTQPSDLSQHMAVGRSWDGRFFELVQTPHFNTDEHCVQKAYLRWCSRLNVWGSRPGAHPTFRCVEPGISTLECNESLSRTAAWEPVEALPPAENCDWYAPDNPQCKLRGTGKRLPKGAPTSPLLRCSPSASLGAKRHSCRVETVRPPYPVSTVP